MSVLNKVRINNVDYDLIGLGGDVLPIGTEIDIVSTAIVPAGWEEVDNKYDIYSTTERCIGRWIDGKPLYQRTLTGTTPSSGDDCIIINDSTIYITSVVEFYVNWNSTTYNSATPVPYGNPNVGIVYYIQDQSTHNKVVLTITQTFMKGANYYCTIRYTKNADSTNTPITKRIKKVTQVAPPSIGDNYSTDEQVIGTWIDRKTII